MLTTVSLLMLSHLNVAADAVACRAYDSVNVFIGTGGLGYGYGSISPAGELKLVYKYILND